MAHQPNAERRPMRIRSVVHDLTHESARARQKRKRERDFKEALPETRDIDRAIVAALREMIARDYKGLVGNAWRANSECGRIVLGAMRQLEREGCDAQNPAFMARILHRLGDHTRDDNLTRSQL